MAKVKKNKEEIVESPAEEKVIPAEIVTPKPNAKVAQKLLLHFPDSGFCPALNKRFKKGVYLAADQAEYNALLPFHKDAPISGFVVNTK